MNLKLKKMKKILEKLYNQEKLNIQEAENILTKIANGEFNDYQIVSFLTVFLMRDISVEELSGFRNALINLCVKIDLSDFNTIDLCGTGGDNKNTFNISTLSSFIVAGTGNKVAKHGNYGVSSISGSSNMLEYFGYKFTNNNSELKKQIETSNICFLHAPLFHPALKSVGHVRKSLGVRTFFNILGPVLNPSNPQNQLTGVYSLEIAELYGKLFSTLDKNYTIVHTLSGYDEISLTDSFKIITKNENKIVSPEYLNMKTYMEKDIVGGKTVKESAKIFLNILEGNGTEAQNNVVLTNAAIAVQTISNKEFEWCFEEVKKSLFDKKALQSLKNLTFFKV